MAFVSGPALPAARLTRAAPTCAPVRMAADAPPPPAPRASAPLSRRALLATSLAAAVAALMPKGAALANREYANVGFLGGGDKIDVNNANVRAYIKLRGFYPGLAGLIVSNGPYESVDELGNIPGLTPAMKKTLEDTKDSLVALPVAPEYELDKVNNGLYR